MHRGTSMGLDGPQWAPTQRSHINTYAIVDAALANYFDDGHTLLLCHVRVFMGLG
jgi:hypothetical protein